MRFQRGVRMNLLSKNINGLIFEHVDPHTSTNRAHCPHIPQNSWCTYSQRILVVLYNVAMNNPNATPMCDDKILKIIQIVMLIIMITMPLETETLIVL
jgi:hypothetical protein